ncbi:MAG TPA: Sapep family Mn(2+)-dependent dipeptidase [Spirochaetia bacterium]|nr:Sapep family Mn(2+)-dependent dipeptidase [Spirochaetia bacterium]
MQNLHPVRSYERQIVDNLRELIRIPSVEDAPAADAPFGEHAARALGFVLERGAALGFSIRNVDNYAGHVQYGQTGPLIGVLVHLDVVPAGDGWKHEPFGAEFEDGCVYGRGASDNKGPAIAALYCLKAFADRVPEPRVRIRVIFGTNEESGMECMKHYFAVEELPEVGFSPDAAYPLYNREKGIFDAHLRARRSGTQLVTAVSGGEALNMVANSATAGVVAAFADAARGVVERYRTAGAVEPRVRIEENGDELGLTAAGVSAHGGSPAGGVSAIAHLVHVLAEVARVAESAAANDPRAPVEPQLLALGDLIGFETRGESLGIACRDEESGDLSVNWGKLIVDQTHIEAALNIRYPVTADYPRIVSVLKSRLADLGFELEVRNHLAPLFIPEDSPLIVKLLRAYARVTGSEAKPQSMAGGTYARMLKNRGVAFGAGFADEDTRAHKPDEFIRIESLMRHAEISTEALFELAGEQVSPTPRSQSRA